MARILVALSGGVDSSVTTAILKRSGHEVQGVVMTHGLSGCEETCGGTVDSEDARKVAELLDVPFHHLDVKDAFEAEIVDYFVEQYIVGRTPNPCIVCNPRMKFGQIMNLADQLGAEYLATGHYARIESPGEREVLDSVLSQFPPGESDEVVQIPPEDTPRLFRGSDPTKDQSYALFAIPRPLLGRILFPLGHYTKRRIRELAAELDLPTADKPESQDICFVPDGNYARLIGERRPEFDGSGEIVLTDGTVVGRHDGFYRYTIGQRKGLGVALGTPHYVVRIDADTCTVVLGAEEDLACPRFYADQLNWLVDPPASVFDCQIKVRYRSRPTDARVTPRADGTIEVEPVASCGAVTPGQAVVCYRGDQVLGGGFIRLDG